MGREGVAGTALEAIGRTPVVRLNHMVPAGSAEVVVKLEAFNPTGSYKDRMARGVIEASEHVGSCGRG